MVILPIRTAKVLRLLESELPCRLIDASQQTVCLSNCPQHGRVIQQDSQTPSNTRCLLTHAAMCWRLRASRYWRKASADCVLHMACLDLSAVRGWGRVWLEACLSSRIWSCADMCTHMRAGTSGWIACVRGGCGRRRMRRPRRSGRARGCACACCTSSAAWCCRCGRR